MEELLKHPLYLAIIDSPLDWARYLVFADYLEEQGMTQFAYGFRFMGKNKKTPKYSDRINFFWEESETWKPWTLTVHHLPRFLYYESEAESCYSNLLWVAQDLAMTAKAIRKWLDV